MPHEVRIPRLGWSMEQGTFTGWKKRDGEPVAAGEPLFELEGEKAVQDIEATDAGVLRIAPDAPSAGTVVPVGRVIGYLLAPGENAPWERAAPATAATSTDASVDSTAVPPTSRHAAHGLAPAAAPSVRRLARDLGVSLEDVDVHGPAARITADDVRRAAAARHAASTQQPRTKHDAELPVTDVTVERAGRRQRATPRARRRARELGIDLTTVSGSGRQGRIRERDVSVGGAARPAAEGGSPIPADTAGRLLEGVAERYDLPPLRRTISARLKRGQSTTVPVTLQTRIDASHLVSLRAQFRATESASATPAIIPTYTDLVVKLCGEVLAKHREFAVRWVGEQLERPASIDIGLAVDTEAGLVVPVVRDVPALKLSSLALATRELVERARTRRLLPSEAGGGIFTVTNLGGWGIDGFTPVLNWPETAILGLGAIRREPVVVDEDRIEPRWQLTLSLTFDHCAYDGAPAARLLQAFRTALENPAAWLLG
ncbi:MAG: 2-oxo acid dehydrogenase subunit E2 [Pirellulales bacterium]